jgi:hypothetical protein
VLTSPFWSAPAERLRPPICPRTKASPHALLPALHLRRVRLPPSQAADCLSTPPPTGKGGKNRRRGKNENDEKRELVFKEDGQGVWFRRRATAPPSSKTSARADNGVFASLATPPSFGHVQSTPRCSACLVRASQVAGVCVLDASCSDERLAWFLGGGHWAALGVALRCAPPCV